MPSVLHLPLVKSALAISFGIVLAHHFPRLPFFPLTLLLVFLLFLFAVSLRKFNIGSYTFESGMVWLFMIILGGTRYNGDKTVHLSPTEGKITGQMVIESVTFKPQLISVVGIIASKEHTYKVKGLYFTQSPDTVSLTAGQLIAFEGDLKNVLPPSNPYQFDAQAFAVQQGIASEVFLDRFALVDKNFNKQLKVHSKEWLATQLEKIPLAEVRSLLWAFTTGDKSKLDKSLKSSFSKAGVMHLLAVSGLHVGLIASLPLFFLKRCRKRWRQLLFLGITLLVCWMYAWLTGFQASVIRASLMCSLVGLSLCLRVNSNSMNQLGAAATFMMILSPSLLFTVGFQLSFAAVAGILLWAPIFQSFFQFRNGLVKKVVNGLWVSLAAQAGSAPISVYYFHQFPLLFLVANFVAIPLATILLYSTLVFLIGQSVGFTPSWLVQLIQFEGLLLVNWAHWIASFSWASLDGLWLTTMEVISCYCALQMLILLVAKKRIDRVFKPVVLSLSLLIGLIYCRPSPSYEITFFGGNSFPHIGLRTERESYMIYTSDRGRYATSGWKERFGATEIELVSDTLVSMAENIWRKGEHIGIGPYLIRPTTAHKKTAQLDGIKILFESDRKVLFIPVGGNSLDSLDCRKEAGVFDFNSAGDLVSKHDLHSLPKRGFHLAAE